MNPLEFPEVKPMAFRADGDTVVVETLDTYKNVQEVQEVRIHKHHVPAIIDWLSAYDQEANGETMPAAAPPRA
jgi:hypothetical protein